MKKLLALLLIALLTLTLVSCGTEEKSVGTSKEELIAEEPVTKELEPEPEREPEPEPVVLSEQDQRIEEINKIITDRAVDKYRSYEIDSITVNENMGDPDSNTFIVLVYSTFTAKNRPQTADDMLLMFMPDIAANLYNEGAEDVAEIAIFAKDEYNNRDLKLSYEWTPNGFRETDKMGFE